MRERWADSSSISTASRICGTRPAIMCAALRLSVIASPDADWDDLHRLVEKGFPIESIEIKGAGATEIGRIAMRIPPGLDALF